MTSILSGRNSPFAGGGRGAYALSKEEPRDESGTGVESGAGVESGVGAESGAWVESGTENIIFDILALYAVRKYVTYIVFSVLCLCLCLKASKLT